MDYLALCQKRLKAVLFLKGISIVQLSKKTGHRASWLYSQLYTDKRCRKSMEQWKLAKIARALNIKADSLHSIINGNHLAFQSLLQQMFSNIHNRNEFYKYIKAVIYYEGYTPSQVYRALGYDSRPDLRKIFKSGSKQFMVQQLSQIANLIGVPKHRLIKPLKSVSNIKPYNITDNSNKTIKVVWRYLKSLFFIHKTTNTKFARSFNHTRTWVWESVFFRTPSVRDAFLKTVSIKLKVPYSNFEKILQGDYRPLKDLQLSMEKDVHDRRSLLDLFMSSRD